MDKQEVKILFEDYHKSINNKNHIRALEQNRGLWSEIFGAYRHADGDKKVLEGGLDQLEIEATDLCKILGIIQLNPTEEL